MKTETIAITTLSGKELNIHVSEGVISDDLIYDLMMLAGKYERERLGITYRNEKESFAFGKSIGMRDIEVRNFMEESKHLSSFFIPEAGNKAERVVEKGVEEEGVIVPRSEGWYGNGETSNYSVNSQINTNFNSPVVEDQNKDIKSPYEIKKNPFLYDPITVRIDRMLPIDPDKVNVVTMVIRRADVRRAEEAQDYYGRGELDANSFVGLMLKLEYKAKNSFLLSDKDGHEYVKFAVYM